MAQYRTLIDALADAPPDLPFITFWVDEDEQETVTFGQFRSLARSQAMLLRRHGAMAGDRVIIIMPQSIDAMTVFAGAMILGAVPAFLAYPNFKVEPAKYRAGLAGVTKNLKAKIVVIDDDFPDELLGHLVLDGTSTLIRAARQDNCDPNEIPVADLTSDSIAFIQHSAGTTGLQKGVALSHSAVLKQLGHLATAMQVDQANDRIYSWLPLYHDMGLIACFMLPMALHLPVVVQSPLDWVMHPEIMLQAVTKHRCTLVWMPNFAFQFMPRRAPRDRWSHCDLSSLRALINCSEPVRASSMDEFQRTFADIGLRSHALQSSYAMAENVFAVTQSCLKPAHPPARIFVDALRFRSEGRAIPVDAASMNAMSFVSSGHLLPNNTARIVSDSGMTVEEGRVGEIQIRSDCLFSGYYNRPDLTMEAIVDGWYHTGDLGFIVGDDLYVVGRKKDLLIVGGENLYPQDIEEIVSTHPAIHDGRVIAMGVYSRELGTEEIVVVAEVEDEAIFADPSNIEQEIRSEVVAGMGVAVRTILLKSPGWIIKSTAGKAARAATREKLFQEFPQLRSEE